MPSIRGSLSDFQPLIDVVVSRSVGEEAVAYCALIDTGATRTCVSRAIVERHQLEPRGKMLVQTAGGFPARERAYAFLLSLVRSTGAAGQRSVYLLPNQLVAPALLQSASFDVLLGMDLLSQGRLSFDRRDFMFEFDGLS